MKTLAETNDNNYTLSNQGDGDTAAETVCKQLLASGDRGLLPVIQGVGHALCVSVACVMYCVCQGCSGLHHVPCVSIL